MKTKISNNTLKYSSLIAIGSIFGFAYWAYIGCETGNCPLKSNVYAMSAYGGLLGFTLASWIVPKKPAEGPDHN